MTSRVRRAATVIAAVLAVVVSASCSGGGDDGREFSGNPVVDGTVTTIDTDLGPVLVSSDGHTLYVFVNDSPEASSCTDTCARTWPPYQPSILTGEFAARLSSFDRPDGSEQVAIDGRPLYHFVGDTEPGETEGHRSAGVWFALDDSGEPIP